MFMSTDDESGKMELKAGSKQHQPLPGIDPEGLMEQMFGCVCADCRAPFAFGRQR